MSERAWTSVTKHRSSAVGRTCPLCRTIHCARDVTAIDRFRPNGASGYRHGLSRNLFATRTEAEADLCRIRTGGAA